MPSTGTDSPLCHASEDVLVRVLHYLVPEYDDEDPSFKKPTVSSLFTWLLPAVSVCRLLRSIALKSPKLWTWVPIGYQCTDRNQKWLDLCYERSGSYPVTLIVNICFLDHYRAQIIRFTPRTRALRIEALNSSGLPHYERLHACRVFYDIIYTRTWPLLEAVSFLGVHSLADAMDDVGKGCPEVKLFDSSAGTLIHLNIRARMLWLISSTSSMEKLVSLTLHASNLSYISPNLHPPHMPQLRCLYLLDCFDYDSCVCKMLRPIAQNSCLLDTLLVTMKHSSMRERSDGDHPEQEVPRHTDVRLDLSNLDFVQIDGDVFFILAILNTLPDAHRSLRLFERGHSAISPSVMETSALILTRVKAYLSVHASGSDSLPTANHIISVSPDDVKNSVSLSVKPLHALSEHMLMRRLWLHLRQETNVDNINTAVGLADSVELWPNIDYEVLFAMIAAPAMHTLQRLVLLQWDTYWTTASEPQRILQLEIFLSDLLWQDRPLGILDVQSGFGMMDREEVLSRWLKEGLVGQICFEGQVMTFGNVS